jgi:dipeptidyl aminopeptidase/acylaminoacyl peptidase
MPDARAHGSSGGDIATFGVMERNDIKGWFEWLQSAGQYHCIFGLGESMGAAELLQSLEVEPNFCAVIAESSFSSFREIAYDRMGQQFHAGPWVGRTILRPLVEIALVYARAQYHLDLAAASPAHAVAHTSVPVLLIHGAVDSNIPAYHSRVIQLENSNVELWEVPGADHCGAISVAPQELEHKITSWFEVHDDKSPRKESTIVGSASYRVSGEINNPF